MKSNAGLHVNVHLGILEQVQVSDTQVIKEWVGLVTMYEVNMTEPDSVVPSDRTARNGHKVKHRKCNLSIRKNFFLLRGQSDTERDCPERLWSLCPMDL